jgi:O-antigen/teichoic acid export membrane protein
MKKIFKDIIANPLFSGSAVMIFGSNFASALNYLYHFVMGKFLTDPSSYGELVALISLTGLLGIIPSSFSLVIIKYISSAKDEKEIKLLADWLKTKTLKFALFFFIVIVMVSPQITSFLHISNPWYVILMGISFFFSLPALINRSVLQGVLRFKEMIFSLLAENIAKLFIGAILVILGFGVGGAIAGIMIAVIVGLYISAKLLSFSSKAEEGKLPDTKSMFLFTLPVILQSFATTSLYTSDVLLVKHFFSSYDAGIYAAFSTLSKIIFFGTGPISAVMFPLVSRRQSRGENYKRIFLYSFLITALFALVLMVLYWIFPSFIITTLYKSAYLQSQYLLLWFGLFIALFTLSSLLINYSLSLGRTKVVVFPLVAAIAQIILIWFYHKTLLNVINISIVITALLLIVLVIYSIYGNKVAISHRSGIQTGKNN